MNIFLNEHRYNRKKHTGLYSVANNKYPVFSRMAQKYSDQKSCNL